MAAEIELPCGACGGHHTFCLADADMFDGNADYEYTCPETQQQVSRRVDAFALVVPGCGRSSVIMRRVGD